MKKGILASITLLALLVAGFVARDTPDQITNRTKPFEVRIETFEIWSQYQGTIESMNAMPVYSQLGHKATITDLAEEGQFVEPGDPVATFDQTSIQERLATSIKDFTLAKAEYESLIHAEIPLEKSEMESNLRKKQREYEKEQTILTETILLKDKGLVSAHETDEQKVRVDDLEKDVGNLKKRLKLNTDILFPSRVSKLKAKLKSTKKTLDLTRQQASNAVIRADRAGMVVYNPLHVEGEYRTIRLGDSVYRRQRFMMIADMDALVVDCPVPESQLSLVRKGNPAVITPLAFPNTELKAEIDHVGSMAHTRSDKPSWQRFFTVRVKLLDADQRLKSGMSVHVHLLSYSEKDAVVVERNRIHWEGAQAWCLIKKGGIQERRNLSLGPSNEKVFVVREGLQKGELVY